MSEIILHRAYPRLDVKVLRHIAADYRRKHKCDVEEVQVCEEIAAAIEAQSRPPKPAEPTGLGAVVEDTSGNKWVRAPEWPGDDHCWVSHTVARPDDSQWMPWHHIGAVRVLSEGVVS